MAGGKASSSSIVGLAGCLLPLLGGEASKRHTVLVGSVMRPLTVEASGDSIPKIAGCVLLILADKVSDKLW